MLKADTLCLALLMLTGLRCEAETKPPTPLWTHTLTWRDSKLTASELTGSEPTDARIVGATPEAILVERAADSIAALDTRTGRELWQKNRQGEPFHTVMDWKGDLTSWRMIGTARRAGMESVALVLRHTEFLHQNMDNSPEWANDDHLLSIGAQSGKTLWQDGTEQQGLSKTDIAVCKGVLVYLWASPEYWDAATGQRLDMATTRGQAQMRRVLAINSGPMRIVQRVYSSASQYAYRFRFDGPVPWTFRVASGKLEPTIGVAVGQCYSPLYVQQDRLITYVNTDNDSAGGSQNPKYLVGSDLGGRRVWQFPAAVPEINYAMGFVPDTIEQAVAIWDTGVCLALDKVSVHGVRVRDGKPLWKWARSGYQFTQPGVWKQGCFGFVSDYAAAAQIASSRGGNSAKVTYLSAQSGKARHVLTLPFVRQVFVGGETLYVQTTPNTFCAYSIPLLMARQSIYKPSRRQSVQAGRAGRR